MRFLTRSLVGLFLAALTLALLAIGAMELKTAIEISTALDESALEISSTTVS